MEEPAGVQHMTEVLHQIERPLKSLSRKTKMDLVVSTVMGVDGKVYVVSRYKDNTWKFHVEIRAKNASRSDKEIKWGIGLPDGSRLSDPQHAKLLESVKDFILSLGREPVEGRNRPKANTLLIKVTNLKPLLRWMVTQNMTRFEHLAGRTRDYVQYAKLDQQKPGKEVAETTHASRLILVEDLYRQRDKLRDAIREHPWPSDSACVLAGRKRGGPHRNKVKTDPIPDRIVTQLVSTTLEYVESMADPLLNAREATQEAREEALEAYADHEDRQAKARIAAKYVADELGFKGLNGIKKELHLLRTACYIVIGIFSGIRDSEMAELQSDCVGETLDKAGVELAWIHGNIIKHQYPDKPHAWIVPPVVIVAIKIIGRLSKPLQDRMQAEGRQLLKRLKKGNLTEQDKARLHTRYSEIQESSKSLFLGVAPRYGQRISPLSNTTINLDLKDFCEHFAVLGDDGKPFPLKTTHFRRTFAYYIARTQKSFDLNYLSRHYGHFCVSQTEAYTHGAPDGCRIDAEILREIEEDKRQIQGEVLEKVFCHETPLVGGKWILELRPKIMTAKNRRELVQKLSENINIIGTGSSWCVTDGRTVCCGGKCYVKRTMCRDCPTGFIGPEFLPMWEYIAEQQQEIIGCDDLGHEQKQEAREMLEEAQMIISDLGGVP